MLPGESPFLGLRVAVKSENKFWAVLLLSSAAFIIVLSYSLMRIVYPLHVEQMKLRARETVNHMQFVLPHLSPSLQQQYLEKIYKSSDDVSYLLLMDIHGNAVAHSNRQRIGMNFNEPGFRRCISEGVKVEQVYIRDAANPSSVYYGEMIYDILDPYYLSDGTIAGAVNVGVSLAAIEKARTTYIIISSIGAFLWILFISGFALTHARTMTLKKKADAALNESERKYRFLVENQNDIVYSIDVQGRITFMGTQIEKYGFDPLTMIGHPIDEYIHPQDRERVNVHISNSIRTGKTSDITFRLVDTSRHETWFETQGSIIRDDRGMLAGLSGILRDITDRKKLEEQLYQSQKMDVVGQLAGGIAHDFNNMLSGIIGSAEMLSFKIAEDSPLRTYVSMILKGAERAAALTKNLLAYSRKGKLISTVINIHEPINDAIGLLERSIDKRIAIRTEFHADDSTVTGDPALLQNAFLNLGLNARDAMPEGGVLTYTTRNVTVDESSQLMREMGRYVEIEVSDTGKGMTPDLMGRIFEPFFTTKEFGKGTGLGLAAVYGTVKDHRGDINVYSEPGIGSIFKIRIPVENKIAGSASAANEEIIKGTGCILIIDDEAIIRNIAYAQLVHLGYEVLLAEDGEAGIEIFTKEKSRISLAIIDLVMPKISGQETLRRILEIEPAAKVIFSSGFNYYEKSNKLIELGAAAFIQKPFQLSKLSRLVFDVIHSSDRSS